MKHAARSSRVPVRMRVSATRITVGGVSLVTLVACLAGAAGIPGWTPIPSDEDMTVVSEGSSDEQSDDVAANRAVALEHAEFSEVDGSEAAGPVPPDQAADEAGGEPETAAADPAGSANWPKTARPVSLDEVLGPPRPPDPKQQPVSSFDDPLPLPEDSGDGRRVVFSISDQYVWLVDEGDKVERRYPVSGSRYDQLEPGSYDVIRTRRHTTSWHGTESMEYMVTFTFGENAAIGFHDIPKSLDDGERVQTADELGMALSDGCIRQRPRDAAALWDFAPVDTPVIVLE